MAIIRRLSRLFLADFHSVLDHIEEPESLLKQALREMEEELEQSEKRIKCIEATLRQIVLQVEDTEQSLIEIDDKLDICLAADNDDLARPLIKRQLESKQAIKSLARKRQELEQQLAQQSTVLNENRSLYESTKQKAAVLTADNISANVSDDEDLNYSSLSNYSPTSNYSAFSVPDEDVELALIQQKQLRGAQKRNQS